MKISFDFDDTLAERAIAGRRDILVCIPKGLDLLEEYHALGCDCIILTARFEDETTQIVDFLKQYNVDHCISEIVTTSHEPKGPFAVELQVSLHYDDSDAHLESVSSFGINTISSKGWGKSSSTVARTVF